VSRAVDGIHLLSLAVANDTIAVAHLALSLSISCLLAD
jgi:hypothetical protein